MVHFIYNLLQLRKLHFTKTCTWPSSLSLLTPELNDHLSSWLCFFLPFLHLCCCFCCCCSCSLFHSLTKLCSQMLPCVQGERKTFAFTGPSECKCFSFPLCARGKKNICIHWGQFFLDVAHSETPSFCRWCRSRTVNMSMLFHAYEYDPFHIAQNIRG